MNTPDPRYPTAVREMPEEERPRERLARLGPEALKDAELMAVLFRTGTRALGAVALAEHLLRHFGDLRGLARASIDEIRQVHGIGQVKAIEIKAALELGKRLASHTAPGRMRITGAADVARLLSIDFKEYETERLKVLLMNTRNELLKIVEVSQGGRTGTYAGAADVYCAAVREGATSIIVAHNHPSGDPEPSQTDIDLTRRLKEAGEILGIRLCDHIVFGDGKYVSLQERQLF